MSSDSRSQGFAGALVGLSPVRRCDACISETTREQNMVRMVMVRKLSVLGVTQHLPLGEDYRAGGTSSPSAVGNLCWPAEGLLPGVLPLALLGELWQVGLSLN